jgi:isocitrate dehydrogenase
VLTDEVAQCHRSPGFITSNLIGKRDDGTMIMEFEASHGTVADMWQDHLAGKETSFNPLGMAEALIGAMQHAASLHAASDSSPFDSAAVSDFAANLRTHIHAAIVAGEGTRDISGPTGLTTEDFVANVSARLEAAGAPQLRPAEIRKKAPVLQKHRTPLPDSRIVDSERIRNLFEAIDSNKDGSIDFEEFEEGLAVLGVLPTKKK